MALVRTVLLKKIHNHSLAYREYNRNSREGGRKWLTDWCNNDMLQMEDTEFVVNFRLSRPSFSKLGHACAKFTSYLGRETIYARKFTSSLRRGLTKNNWKCCSKIRRNLCKSRLKYEQFVCYLRRVLFKKGLI